MNTTTNRNTESFALLDHDPNWSSRFDDEKLFLQNELKGIQIGRIEHIGSTAIQGIQAKSIIDMLLEVPSQQVAREEVAQILTSHGYDHILHDGLTHDEPVQSSWFIKRNAQGERTHHIWCAEGDTPVRNRVLFVQYLNQHPQLAQEYQALKIRLLEEYPVDRKAYTVGKGAFIDRVTALAVELQ